MTKTPGFRFIAISAMALAVSCLVNPVGTARASADPFAALDALRTQLLGDVCAPQPRTPDQFAYIQDMDSKLLDAVLAVPSNVHVPDPWFHLRANLDSFLNEIVQYRLTSAVAGTPGHAAEESARQQLCQEVRDFQ
jgi:hypothetical protein